MKNIAIILVLAVGSAVAGWVSTIVVVQHHQTVTSLQPTLPGHTRQEWKNSMVYYARVSAYFARRQTDPLIGGGLGLAAGVALGIGVASIVGKSRSGKAAA